MFIFTPEDLIKVLVAVVIGGIIGFERELHSKAAGLRTITLITVGATMFTILSARYTDTATSRVAPISSPASASWAPGPSCSRRARSGA